MFIVCGGSAAPGEASFRRPYGAPTLSCGDSCENFAAFCKAYCETSCKASCGTSCGNSSKDF